MSDHSSAPILAASFALLLASASAAPAMSATPGAANFNPPSYVPDYFSNESGPFRGAAASAAIPAAPRYAAPSYTTPGATAGYTAPSYAAPAAGHRVVAVVRPTVARTTEPAGRGRQRIAYARPAATRVVFVARSGSRGSAHAARARPVHAAAAGRHTVSNTRSASIRSRRSARGHG